MGRGSSKAGGAVGFSATQVVVQSGHTIDLQKPLVYGQKDSTLTPQARQTIEAFEKRRVTNKIEYAICVDDNGKAVNGADIKGGRGSVYVSPNYFTKYGATAMSHNHPRGKGEEGLLGGTFSTGDLSFFCKYNHTTMRATAAEGTYSMSKKSSFNAKAFSSYYKSCDKKNKSVFNQKKRQIQNDLNNGKIGYRQAVRRTRAAFNTYLIDSHNDLLAGQNKYGYTYTLEK